MAHPRIGRPDLFTTSLFFTLLALGWIMYYAASYRPDVERSIFDITQGLGKETLWVGLALLVFFGVQMSSSRFWPKAAFVFYIIGILLLVGVLFLGTKIKGATSWYSMGGISFQPSEFAKFGTALALSSLLSGPSDDMTNPKTRWLAFGIIGLPVLLILLQPDAGSALVFLSFFILFFRKGLNPQLYVIGGVLIALFILSLMFEPVPISVALLGIGLLLVEDSKSPNRWTYPALILASIVFAYYFRSHSFALVPLGFFALRRIWRYFLNSDFKRLTLHAGVLAVAMSIVFGSRYFYDHVLEPHQQERINVWLNPSKCDPHGSLYNVLQSKMAIGSGGLTGRGFLKGKLTQLNYVPEQSTDFIFCTIGEEHGFIGTTFTILIFLTLVLRLTYIAERQRLSFARNYGYALAGIIFFHFLINIGMTMGLFPIIGIPLPMVSYGGTSLLMFTLMLSVMIKLDASRQTKA